MYYTCNMDSKANLVAITKSFVTWVDIGSVRVTQCVIDTYLLKWNHFIDWL